MGNDDDQAEREGSTDEVSDLDAFPLSDVLTAMQNAASKGKDYEGKSRSGAPLADAAPLYPYTKGVELTNDGIGYGEETSIVVVEAEGGAGHRTKRWTRYARRTRSGSRFLQDTDKLPSPAATPRSSAARETPGSE